MDAAHAQSVQRFIDDLNKLRLEAGNPSLRKLAELSGAQFSRNALDDHLSHRRVRLPPWDLVAAYVTACHKAATSTGLDARPLGTLKGWHERYLAALRGEIPVSGPFTNAVESEDGGVPAGATPSVHNRVTTGLQLSLGPTFTQRRNRNLDGFMKGDIVHSSANLNDLVEFGAPIIDSDDEAEITAQGAGKWLVRWLPRQPSRAAAGPPAAPDEEDEDEESTEALPFPNATSLDNRADLTVSLAAGAALLLIKRGPYSGIQFAIRHDRTTIGRDPASDVFLDDTTVSRAHSVIYRRGGRFIIRDAGSLNCTYVNRRPVTDEFLSSGDDLQIGVFKFLFLQGY